MYRIYKQPELNLRVKPRRGIKISRKNIVVQFDVYKPEGDVDLAADCSKAKRILNWTPKVSINEGLKKTYDRWCLGELSSDLKK